MSCWNLLGIEPTSNKVEIKKAFARKVKENPPDKDPVLYQEIREAYNEAIKLSSHIGESEYSDFKQKEESPITSSVDSEPSVENSSEIPAEETQNQTATENFQSGTEESDDVFFENLASKIKNLKDEKTASKISEIRDKMSGNQAVKLKDLIDYVPYREPPKISDKSQQEKEPSEKLSSRITYKKVRIIISLILLFIILILKVSH